MSLVFLWESLLIWRRNSVSIDILVGIISIVHCKNYLGNDIYLNKTLAFVCKFFYIVCKIFFYKFFYFSCIFLNSLDY
jgi:hypothetical protein